MKTEGDIARDLARRVFSTDEPTDAQCALVRKTFAFQHAVLAQRRAELVDEFERSLPQRIRRFFRRLVS